MDIRTDKITEAQEEATKPVNEDEEWVDGIGWVDWATYTNDTYNG